MASYVVSLLFYIQSVYAAVEIKQATEEKKNPGKAGKLKLQSGNPFLLFAIEIRHQTIHIGLALSTSCDQKTKTSLDLGL